MRGWQPLHLPICGRSARAWPCHARRPGGFCKDIVPAPTYAGAPPCTRVTFSPMRKSPKNLPEGRPLWVLPLRGARCPPLRFPHPPKDSPQGLEGELVVRVPTALEGELMVRVRSALEGELVVRVRSATGGELVVRVASRLDRNRKWEQGNKHLFLLYIHLYIYLY